MKDRSATVAVTRPADLRFEVMTAVAIRGDLEDPTIQMNAMVMTDGALKRLAPDVG